MFFCFFFPIAFTLLDNRAHKHSRIAMLTIEILIYLKLNLIPSVH